MNITIFAKDANGIIAALYVTSDAKWAALVPADTLKMQTFFPAEVFEISVSSNESKFLRQGCKVDFAYTTT